MKKMISACLTACMILLCLPSLVACSDDKQPGIFFVAPNGNDQNSGSKSRPFATLDGARKAVRKECQNMQSDITVYFRGGVYPLADTVIFDSRDSGTNGFDILYKAYEDEQVIISGGRQITGWTRMDNGLWKAKTDLSDFRHLYVGDRRAARAHTEYKIPGGVDWYIDADGNKTGMLVDDPLLNSLAGEKDLELVSISQWRCYRIPITEVIAADTGVVLALKRPALTFATEYPMDTQPLQVKVSFVVENSLSLLDQPGEWFLDTAAGEVYYYPLEGEDMTKIPVYAPVVETMISLEGQGIQSPVHNLVFEGLSFRHGNWMQASQMGYVPDQASSLRELPVDGDFTGAPAIVPGHIYLQYAQDIRFAHNEFTQLGAAAIQLYNAVYDAQLVGNRFYDISDSAILIGNAYHANPDPSGQQYPCERMKIANNVIEYTGQEYWSACSVQAYYTKGLVIEHNEIGFSPYTAISLGWGWTASISNDIGNNVIRNNYIHDVVMNCWDGGNIYTLGRQTGSRIEGNYFTNHYNDCGAVYLDNGTQDMLVQNNVLGNVTAWLFINEGAGNNTVKDNYVLREDAQDYSLATKPSAITGTSVYTPDNPPQAVLDIIQNAGLQPDYAGLRYRPRDPENIAKGKPATASSHQADAPKALDGNVYTQWESANAAGQWLQVDLGKLYEISRFDVYHDQAQAAFGEYKKREGNTLDFNLLVSDDGESWAVAYQVRANYGPVTTVDLPKPVQGRYLRLDILQANPQKDQVARIRSLEVFGQEK